MGDRQSDIVQRPDIHLYEKNLVHCLTNAKLLHVKYFYT